MKLLKRKPQNPMQDKRIRAERQAYSYYANRTIIPSDTRAKRSRQQAVNAKQDKTAWWQQLPTYFLIVILIGSTGYLLSLNSDVRVSQYVNPSETQYLREISVYEVAAENLLRKSVFNYNKVTVNTSGITNSLAKEFPELAGVSLTLPFFGRRPVLEIVPATPVLLLVSKTGSFALDKNGKAIIDAQDAPGLSAFALPQVRDEVGADIKAGDHVLPKDNIDFIVEVLAQLQAKDLTTKLIILPATVNELHIQLETVPYYIKLNTSSSARQQIGTYFALKERLEASNTMPKEYIDVRTEEKAYYR